jgi:hypothetical protein
MKFQKYVISAQCDFLKLSFNPLSYHRSSLKQTPKTLVMVTWHNYDLLEEYEVQSVKDCDNAILIRTQFTNNLQPECLLIIQLYMSKLNLYEERVSMHNLGYAHTHLL